MALGVGRKELVMVGVLLVGVLLAVLNQTLIVAGTAGHHGRLASGRHHGAVADERLSLVEAVVIPLSAYLIGRFSTRQLFISAFALFTAGSLAAAVAPNFWVLLLGRVLQAACTGMSMPMVFTVILLVFPREKRGTAMGVIGLIIGFAPAVGPSVAGPFGGFGGLAGAVRYRDRAVGSGDRAGCGGAEKLRQLRARPL